MGGPGANGLNCLVLENIEVPALNATCLIADSPLYTIFSRLGYNFIMKMLMIFCLQK